MIRSRIEHPIPPFFTEDSRVLILGSFPSVKTRESGFFYGHPQNRFWKVVAAVFGETVPVTIPEKKALLKRNHIALWDVIQSCDIAGSSDASIQNVIANDLTDILNRAPIERIIVNGRTAERYYRMFTEDAIHRTAVCLPSTSPANAAWKLEDLVEEWKIIKEPGMDPSSLPALERVVRREETVWINPKKQPFAAVRDALPLSFSDIEDAESRLQRFAPLIAELFPETRQDQGIIESELTEIPAMKAVLAQQGGPDDDSRLFLKRDSDLAVAGSVKARGGIYEVLKHAEELALENGLLSGPEDDCRKLASDGARRFFGTQKIQVGSTGNLGLSIGIMSASLGFQAIVHMSSDAKEWKKELLRASGVRVIEYAGDYGEAVARGRRESDADPASYFVDDENSKDLFLGYATAALRLERQLSAHHVRIDDAHPLIVTIPCGVGGAPGGITFGLKHVFGDRVHVFFAEPTEACSMLVGLVTGKHHAVSVQDVGLSGKTEADGLAVSRPSGFVGRVIEPLLSGEVTVRDERLLQDLRALWESEAIFAEPSACAGFQGIRAFSTPEMREYLNRECPGGTGNAVHLVWATGGRLVPEQIRKEWLS